MTIRTVFEFLHRRRFLIQTAFVVFVTAIYVWLVQGQSSWVRNFENSMLELRLQMRAPRPPPPDVVILKVTESAFRQPPPSPAVLALAPEMAYMVDSWPWNVKFWATVTERLLKAGARVVVIDNVFNVQTPDDAALRDVIEKYPDRVVIAAQLAGGVPGRNEYILEPTDDILPRKEADVVGLNNLPQDVDPDGLVRSVQNYRTPGTSRDEWPTNPAKPLPKRPPEEYSISWLAAKKALGFTPMRNPDTRMPLNYYGGVSADASDDFSEQEESIKTIPIEDALLDWDTTYKHGESFKDKVVFIGTSAEVRFNDSYNTPLDYKSAVEIQATAFANLVHSDWLVPASDWTVLLLALGLGALALAVSLGVRAVLLKIGLFLALAATFLVATQHLFWSELLVTPVAGAAIILVSCGLFGAAYDYMLGQYERQRMLGMFESMVSPGVAGLMLSQRGDFEKRLGGQRQELVVLFGDIRGFTTLSERVGPDALVAQLNEHLSAMVSIVQEEGGTLQKYIGDAFMAAWGDVRAQPPADGAEHAVRAGLRMQEALKKLNADWKGQHEREQLSFGVGINHGEGVVGYIGHPRRKEFSVMGDTVNLAARLESATKQYHQPILVGETVYEMTKKLFYYRLADKMQVQGKTHAVLAYVPMGERIGVQPPGLPEYTAALEKYYARDFAGAAELLRAANVLMGGKDFLCQNFHSRCEYYFKTLPPLDWDGTWVLKDK
jgi:adenylate cyclase